VLKSRTSQKQSVSTLKGLGQTAWEGIVYVFDLEGHPEATVCYAWSLPVDDSDQRKFYAVLHVPLVDSPEAAVLAAIVAEHKASLPE